MGRSIFVDGMGKLMTTAYRPPRHTRRTKSELSSDFFSRCRLRCGFFPLRRPALATPRARLREASEERGFVGRRGQQLHLRLRAAGCQRTGRRGARSHPIGRMGPRRHGRDGKQRQKPPEQGQRPTTTHGATRPRVWHARSPLGPHQGPGATQRVVVWRGSFTSLDEGSTRKVRPAK